MAIPWIYICEGLHLQYYNLLSLLLMHCPFQTLHINEWQEIHNIKQKLILLNHHSRQGSLRNWEETWLSTCPHTTDMPIKEICQSYLAHSCSSLGSDGQLLIQVEEEETRREPLGGARTFGILVLLLFFLLVLRGRGCRWKGACCWCRCRLGWWGWVGRHSSVRKCEEVDQGVHQSCSFHGSCAASLHLLWVMMVEIVSVLWNNIIWVLEIRVSWNNACDLSEKLKTTENKI